MICSTNNHEGINGTSDMRILFLTAHLPFPPASGGRRREFELLSRLGKKFEVHLCSLTTDLQIDTENAKELQGFCQSVSLFKAHEIPQNKYACRYPWLMRRYYSDQAIIQISQMLAEKKFDIVHVEGYYLMQLVRCKSGVHVLLVEHNMEYTLNLQRMLLSPSLVEAQFYWQEYYYTLYWERYYWRRATKIIAITSDDEASIRRLEPDVDVILIPNGTDHDFGVEKSNKQEMSNDCTLLDSSVDQVVRQDIPSILFVGNFLYYPNIDAALYFCKDIFPLILKEVPNAILFIVGNSPPPEIQALGAHNKSNVVITGYVSSLYSFYKSAKVVVCPLRIGGGIKVKILEAVRAGKAIVSTSVGAQGLNIDNEFLCIADKVSDFADYVIRFLSIAEERHHQEQNALQFAKTMPTWNQVSEDYVRCYSEISEL
jgi:glycosyltransferase involved in cell wall biosynthesis